MVRNLLFRSRLIKYSFLICFFSIGDIHNLTASQKNAPLLANSWTGIFNTDWNNLLNWSGGVPTATSDVTIGTTLGNYPVLSTGAVGIAASITINSGASLTVTGNTLKIAGAIANSGTFNVTDGTIELNGTGAQNIGGNYFVSRKIKALTINKSSGTATLTDSICITRVLTISAGTFDMNNVALNLPSDATNTARIATVTGTILNATKVTVERYIPDERRAYRLLAPSVTTTTSINRNWQEGVFNTEWWGPANIDPFPGYGTHITGSGANSNGFDLTYTNASSLFTYTNPATGVAGQWVAVASTLTNVLDATKGYLMFVRGSRSVNMTSEATPLPTSAATLRATGTIKTGTVSYTGLYNTGFSLIANPYASPLNWNSVRSANTNSGNLSTFYTYWEPTIGTRGGYVTVDADGTVTPLVSVGSGSVNATVEIQSGQAFFVKGIGGTGGININIQEAHKSTNNNIRVFAPKVERPSLRVNLYFDDATGNTQQADGLLVRFDNEYLRDFDAYDAEEIANFDENIRWRTAQKNLSVDSRPLPQNADTLFMQTARLKSQNYRFQFIPEAFNSQNVIAYLVDRYTGVPTNISLDSASFLAFTVNTGIAASIDADRFYILLEPGAPLPVTFTSVKAFQKGVSINLEWQVAQQINISNYQIEKSITGKNFKTAGAISVTDRTTYNWFDASPENGNNFYRIKTIDNNGNIAYSKIVKINYGNGATASIGVYPNPVTGSNAMLQLNNVAKGNYKLTISNNAGQIVFTQTFDHTGGSSTQFLNFKNLLAPGIYQLKIAGISVAVDVR